MRRATNRPDTRVLCHIGLDAVLDRRQLELLALHTEVIIVSRGTLLASSGRFARQFVAVIDGHVDVIDSSGRTYVAGPGTHIGGAELIDRRPHDATFVTRSDCHLVVIASRALKAAFHTRGVAGWVNDHPSPEPRAVVAAAPHTARTLALVN